MSKVESSVVTLCSKLVGACAKPENLTFLVDILYPFFLQSFSLEIALDDGCVALGEYSKIAASNIEIAGWLDKLNKKRAGAWFVPVLVPDANARDTSLYLAIFRNTVSREKALLCASKQDYQLHELGDVLDNMCDKNESVNYITRFAKGRGSVKNITITASNSIVNFQSHLDGANQSIKNAGMAEATKTELGHLIDQLSAELKKLPAQQQEEADAVGEVASELVKKASQPNPNKKAVQISAKGLLEAAKGIASVIPIATSIVGLIVKFLGFPLTV